ncbi:UDP-Glycosyltransferase/glycogen phosphorylase [Gigaspora margarita]|uniref:UDP-Glycosyltransferase/glycogen phosphorylase n=1 Tax=Gigaspora margarita TaxID=4874 RepID=A0A8H4ALG1_GIGMA|nr:UDP-Glycosyltransferase/glycogen phosphorylase [Gigaspora margarita]
MDRGYNVTLVAPGNFTANSELYRSIPQIIVGESVGTSIIHDQELLKKFLNEESNANLISKLFDPKLYTKFYKIYKRVAEEINIDLFICDAGMNSACFDLAWQLEKPVIGFASTSTFFSAPPYKSDPLHGCHVTMENESFYDRFKCAIISPFKPLWTLMSLESELNKQRVNLGVEPYWDPRSRMNNILFLVDTFFGFELPAPTLPLQQEIGPILPDTFPNLTPELDSFLNIHPRTMYFALGTNVFTTPQNIAILLKSCLELINQNIIDGVIWATVKTNITELMSFSNTDFPISNILNNNFPHFHITKFAPQFAILSHENTKVFLSHGGASSSHESIYTATPTLVLPIMGDQFGNAEKLEVAGMALKLSKFNLTVDDIVLKIKRLLSEESFKKNAERLSFVAKLNSKRKYRAADLIEMVMNTVKYDGIKDENGNLRTNNNVLLRDWITANKRMGFIKGNYIDVYGTFIILFLALICGFGYISFIVITFLYKHYKYRNSNSKSKKN